MSLLITRFVPITIAEAECNISNIDANTTLYDPAVSYNTVGQKVTILEDGARKINSIYSVIALSEDGTNTGNYPPESNLWFRVGYTNMYSSIADPYPATSTTATGELVMVYEFKLAKELYFFRLRGDTLRVEELDASGSVISTQIVELIKPPEAGCYAMLTWEREQLETLKIPLTFDFQQKIRVTVTGTEAGYGVIGVGTPKAIGCVYWGINLGDAMLFPPKPDKYGQIDEEIDDKFLKELDLNVYIKIENWKSSWKDLTDIFGKPAIFNPLEDMSDPTTVYGYLDRKAGEVKHPMYRDVKFKVQSYIYKI